MSIPVTYPAKMCREVVGHFLIVRRDTLPQAFYQHQLQAKH